jgi:thiol:disulfide interchange protein DsbD
MCDALHTAAHEIHGDAMKLFARLARSLFALSLICLALPAVAQDDDLLPVTEAFHLTTDASQPGMVKLHWQIAPDYYLYRGRVKIKALDEGKLKLGEVALPDGKKKHDEYLGDVEIYHGAVDATLPYTLSDSGAKTVDIAVQYQGCHEVDPKICYPPNTEKLSLVIGGPSTIPAATATPANLGAAIGQLSGNKPAPDNGQALPPEQAYRLEAIATAPDKLLLRWTMPKSYYLYRDKTELKITSPAGASLGEPDWPSGVAHHDQYFGDAIVYFDTVELPVPLTNAGDAKQVTLQATFQGCQENGICYPVMTRQVTLNLSGGMAEGTASPAASATAATDDVAPTPPPPGAGEEKLGVFAAIAAALLGGLILNLMPCVLPVLSLKAVSVIESGDGQHAARKHALFYTAGVMVSFAVVGLLVVGLRAAGQSLGWGFQLQQPVVIAVLIYVMLAVGLAMSGVFQLGASLANTGSGLASRSGPSGDFFTGVLAVVVASPCTAPFMGPALAYAFAAPTIVALLIFLALGVGLALPFLLIGFVPAIGRLLPRPGRWMETLKQVLAFPMYLTAVWLVWVLANQRGSDAVGLVLGGAVLLAMALWWMERSRGRGVLSHVFVAVLAIAAIAPLFSIYHLPRPQAGAAVEGEVAYSPEKLDELRKSGTPVFVDMTADWCVTCKANEHAVLDTDAFRALLKRTGTVYMKGDWTDVNATIAKFLEQYHSVGVPLYVVFPKDGSDGRKLRTVLTYADVEKALESAAK